MGRQMVKFCPLYMFRPSYVPNHILSFESWKIYVTELLDRPSAFCLNLIVFPFERKRFDTVMKRVSSTMCLFMIIRYLCQDKDKIK